MREFKITIIAIATLFAVACNKEELSIDNTSKVEETEFFKFEFVSFTGVGEFVLSINKNDVVLYTFVAESNCIRLTGTGEGISLPKFAERKGNSLLVTLSSGDVKEVNIVNGGANIEGIGFAEKLLYVNACGN